MALERIILDCDPGHDDAVALAIARAFSDRIKTEAIIACHGNQTLDKTLVNALNLAQAFGYDCPVYRGSEQPLVREQVPAGQIHGENGLAGPTFPPCTRECAGNGIEAALRLVIDNPGEITFVTTGPFTDLAICLKADPRFGKSLKRIVVMGGSMTRGNVTSEAEFNVFADPEAAQIVFSSGLEVVQFGLDVTLQVTMNEDIMNVIRGMKDTSYKKMFLASMENYIEACRKYIHDYPSMHDPCTIAYLIDPSIFEFERRPVCVDCRSTLSYGRTVTTWPDEKANVLVGVKADAPRFWNLLFETLKRLP